MFLSLIGKRDRDAGGRLYGQALARSRDPRFYGVSGAPDTLDGRFDLLCLHVFMAVERLGREGARGRTVAQAVFDAMFLDIERALRETGVGDLSVPRHVRRMMTAFNGRCRAYAAAADAPALCRAIARNVFGTDGEAAGASIAAYMERERAALAARDLRAILSEGLFPEEGDDGDGAEIRMVASG